MQQSDLLQYQIKSGDTLSGIILKLFAISPNTSAYHIKLDEILALNPQITNIDAIRAGDTLVFTAEQPTPQQALANSRANPLPQPVQASIQEIKQKSARLNLKHSILNTNQPSALAQSQLTRVQQQVQVTARQIPHFDSEQAIVYSPKPSALKQARRFHQQRSANTVQTQHTAEEQWLINWLANNPNSYLIPTGIAAGTMSNLMNQANVNLIRNIETNYLNYKQGQLTKGQYDYARKKALDQLRKNIGPLEKLLFGQHTPHQVVKIARKGAMPANVHIQHHANRLSKIGNVAGKAGYILAGVGVAAGCYQIAHTTDQQLKNEIFVETVVSTAIGVITGLGFGLGLFLISNPIGWGTALVLAAGSGSYGYLAGTQAKLQYKNASDKFDYVHHLKVQKICS